MKLNEVLDQDLEELKIPFMKSRKEKELQAKHGSLWKKSTDQLRRELEYAKGSSWLPKGSKRPHKIKSALDDKLALAEAEDSYKPPTINVGDEVRVGKWKNRKAEVKGFKTDDKGQPVLKTNKGDQKLFKPRITKLMPKDLQEDSERTISKFWLNVKEQRLVSMMDGVPLDDMDDEHDDYIGFEVDAHPLDNHWVRGGFSHHDETYYLEGKNIQEIRKALIYLNKHYNDEFKGVSYDIEEPEKSGLMDWEQSIKFMKHGTILNEFKVIPIEAMIGTIKVYQNPSSKELRKLLNQYGELRGLAWEENFYVWNAEDESHYGIYAQLGGPDDENGVMYDENTIAYYISWTEETGTDAEEWDIDSHWSEKEQDELYVGYNHVAGKDHPMVQRALA